MRTALFWVDGPALDSEQFGFVVGCLPDGWKWGASTEPHDFSEVDAVIIPPFYSFHEFAGLSLAVGSMLDPNVPYAISITDSGDMPVPPELEERRNFAYFQFDWWEPERIKAWLAGLPEVQPAVNEIIEELCSLLEAEFIENAELKRLLDDARLVSKEQKGRINDLEVQLKQLEYAKSFLEEELRKSSTGGETSKLTIAVVATLITGMITLASTLGNTALEAHLKNGQSAVAARCEEVITSIEGDNNTIISGGAVSTATTGVQSVNPTPPNP